MKTFEQPKLMYIGSNGALVLTSSELHTVISESMARAKVLNEEFERDLCNNSGKIGTVNLRLNNALGLLNFDLQILPIECRRMYSGLKSLTDKDLEELIPGMNEFGDHWEVDTFKPGPLTVSSVKYIIQRFIDFLEPNLETGIWYTPQTPLGLNLNSRSKITSPFARSRPSLESVERYTLTDFFSDG